jgi:hypothetical protein
MVNADGGRGRTAGHTLLLIWIVLSALFYFARFSFAFYYANQDAIQALLGS